MLPARAALFRFVDVPLGLAVITQDVPVIRHTVTDEPFLAAEIERLE